MSSPPAPSTQRQTPAPTSLPPDMAEAIAKAVAAALAKQPKRPEREWLSIEDVAALGDVSLRTAHNLRKEPWFPRPIAMGGPKTIRYSRAEVLAAFAARPRLQPSDCVQPDELARGLRARVEALKNGGAS